MTKGRFPLFFRLLFRRAAAALGLAAMLASAPAAARNVEARPALWEVRDSDTTIYLFGTIHLLPDNVRWRTARFDQALERAQQLVVETIVDDKDPTKLMAALASMGFARGLPPIDQRVPPAKRAELARAIARSGIPKATFDQMKSWTAAFTLMTQQFKSLGVKGDQGVEAVLRGAFSVKGKPIGELETNAEQLGFFDRLPEAAQRALLVSALENDQEAGKEFAGMLKAWTRGDVAAIARTFDHDLAASPELQAALVGQRNANWSRWIGQRMAQPGAVMVAVGAGHLAGKASLVAMLQKQGYRVRRLQ